MSLFVWTRTPPTQNGWYWWRARQTSPPQPCWVSRRRVTLFSGDPIRMRTAGRRTRIYGEWWPVPIKLPDETPGVFTQFVTQRLCP